ncbi:tyrosine-type recombinase/integrase [Marininema halotolerans]|uniref:Phage integrase family protein n=1 Tax=Marininema halotolerans TaxID=1155944 RepID=A0A1I6Q4F6_9BACL|nr:tyrosine-type recombinase/integrase [Marininema halotolerans]SFS47205.1 Phage integrase family protein [Marininema halotolerans]
MMETVEPIRSKREINAMKRHLSPRDRLLFVMGINSALRISDLLRLKVRDVRGATHLSIREQKTNKPKKFLLNGAIQRELSNFLTDDMTDEEFLFKSRKGMNQPITSVQAGRALKNAATKAGIKDNINTHSLRKTWAYWRFISGEKTAHLQSVEPFE